MIKAGDIVTVSFSSGERMENLRVDHKPTMPGDSWYFTNMENLDEWVISEGCTIRKQKELNK